MINYSWTAYENGLKQLSDHVFQEDYTHGELPEYGRLRHLQSELIQNITQVRHQGDTPASCITRKRLVAELDQTMKQAIGESFIELCTTTSPALEYLVCVYKAAQWASELFREEEIWADRCQNIVEQFHKRPVLDDITTDISNIIIDAYYIDGCVNRLIQLIEDFKQYCLPNRKPTAHSRNKQAKIHKNLTQFIEEVQHIKNSSFEEFLCWYQKTVLSTGIEQPFPDSSQHSSWQEYVQISLSVAGNIVEDDPPPSKTQADSAERERQHQDSYQQPVHERGEKSSESDIDQTILREKMVWAFDEEELELLCANISQLLRRNGIHEPFSLDMVKGVGLPMKVQNLIGYCDRRGWLSYLITETRKARPNLDL